MWIEDIDDITLELEQDGELVIRQEERQVIARGAWPLVAFLYRERGADGSFGPPKVSVRRFRRQHDAYRLEGKLNLSLQQVRDLASLFQRWADAADQDAGSPGSR